MCVWEAVKYTAMFFGGVIIFFFFFPPWCWCRPWWSCVCVCVRVLCESPRATRKLLLHPLIH